MTVSGRKTLFNGVLFCCVVSGLCFYSATGAAQTSGGSITGRITDPTGAVIVGAPVTIRNINTDIARQLNTNPEGIYTARNLQPGLYEIVVSPPGFRKYVRRVELNVGTSELADIQLLVGDTKQDVQVTTEQSPVELTTATISEVVDAKTVTELPLNGRSWADLTVLQPGVVAVQTQTPLATRA